MLSDASNKEAYHYTKLFTLMSDMVWPQECPACEAKAYVAGIQYEEEILEQEPDEYVYWEIVEKTYSAEQFSCPVCKLFLDGVDVLETADIDLYHTEQEEREMEFEPDYGND